MGIASGCKRGQPLHLHKFPPLPHNRKRNQFPKNLLGLDKFRKFLGGRIRSILGKVSCMRKME